MNWLTLGLVFPSSSLLLVARIITLYKIAQKDPLDRADFWANLNEPVLFWGMSVTLVLAGCGFLATFVLFVVGTSEAQFAAPIMLAWNVSATLSNYAMLQQRRHTVLACLFLNATAAIALFIYTGVFFNARNQSISVPLVFAAHIGNAFGIFHALFVDILVWYESWAQGLVDRELSATSSRMIELTPDMRL